MGAQQFVCEGVGANAAEAFAVAQNEAYYWHGHNGYTGTIAEKPNYKEFPVPEGVTVDDLITALEVSWQDQGPLNAIYGEGNEIIPEIAGIYDDKWQAAVALRKDESTWVFCGWASC